MSSLPLISHHLFVEAIDGEKHRKTPVTEPPTVTLKGIATALPLELLEAVDAVQVAAARQLQVSAPTGGS